MDGAALVVAIVALAASGLAVWYTRHIARIEADRRHDERRPELVGECDIVDGDTRLTLTNRGRFALDGVSWTVRLDVTRSPLVGLQGERKQGNVSSGELGALGVGQPRTLLAEVDMGTYGGPSQGAMTFECVASAGKETWPLAVTVDVFRYDPPPPPMVIWS